MFKERSLHVTRYNCFLIAGLLLLSACGNSPQQPLVDGSVQAAKTESSEQWHCEGDSNKQWRCRDLSELSSQPLSATTEPTPPAPEPVISEATAATATPVVDNKPPATIPTPSVYDNHQYVVQLIAAREPATIARFSRQNPQIPTTRQLTVEKDGEQWLVLILGTYGTYSEAKQAVDAITPPPITEPWIRPIGPIRDILKDQY